MRTSKLWKPVGTVKNCQISVLGIGLFLLVKKIMKPLIVFLCVDWGVTQGLTFAERVSRLKQSVTVRFPTFYGVVPYEGKRTQAAQDARIARALDEFGPQRA
jgi:hypothetical protein